MAELLYIMTFLIRKYCFMFSVWKVFCWCAQYTFLVYRLEGVLFVCTVHISGVPPGKCSVCVHNTIFLTYRLESVLFLCTVHNFCNNDVVFIYVTSLMSKN